MKLTQITVSYGETQSLPEYSNVKSQITLTATLDEGDDPAGAEGHLWQLAKDSVHEQIDLALEANGRPAKHSADPRYEVYQTIRSHWRRPEDPPDLPPMVVIVPDGANVEDKRLVSASHAIDSRHQRYPIALRIATDVARERDAELFDCSDGNLLKLDAALLELDEAAIKREREAAEAALASAEVARTTED
jgi:hypothetical protein